MTRRFPTTLAAMVLGLAAAPALAQQDAAGAEASAQPAQGALDLEQVIADASYAIGMDIANNMKQSGLELDVERLAAGMRAAYGDTEPEMTATEAQSALAALQQAMQQRMQAEAQAMAAQGQELLTANAQRDDVTVTESGLQYEILREGEGLSPSAEDRVTVHYEGRTVAGEVFDSSYERGEPATFPLSGVIPGWSEGVALMQEGAKYKFWIPADLAYGQRGAPRAGIGPNQVLIFDVELLEVDPEAAEQEASG